MNKLLYIFCRALHGASPASVINKLEAERVDLQFLFY